MRLESENNIYKTFNSREQKSSYKGIKNTARAIALAASLNVGAVGNADAESQQPQQPYFEENPHSLVHDEASQSQYYLEENGENLRIKEVEVAQLAMESAWNRVDLPVESGIVDRTWMYGPSHGVSQEFYDGKQRVVEYFDKGRLEVNDPYGDPQSEWYVTSGLLAKELVTGKLQIGDTRFVESAPAEVHIAGDFGDEGAPTYASFANRLEDPAIPEGTLINTYLDKDGNVYNDQGLDAYGVESAVQVNVGEVDHSVASPFWEFMNKSDDVVYEDEEFRQGSFSENPFYHTGLPITEAYWTQVNVDGHPKDVLVQVFERRVMTYTPGNSEGWEVESGNVGLHYQEWRRELAAGGVACYKDMRQLPDGTWVNRDPENDCQFPDGALPPETVESKEDVACYQDARQTEDGEWVNRDPENDCQFPDEAQPPTSESVK